MSQVADWSSCRRLAVSRSRRERFLARVQLVVLLGGLLTGTCIASLTQAAFNLYVASSTGVTAYNQSGNPLAGFTPIATGGNLQGPQGITIGPDGVLYVVGQDSANVLRYNATTGAFIDELINLGPGRDPEGTAFGPDTNGDSIADLYVAEFSTNDVVVVPTAGTGAGVATLFATEEMQQPIAINWHSDGKLYVASRGTHQIQRYNSDGTFDQTFASSTLSPGGFTFSPDGSTFYTGNTFVEGTTIEQYDSFGNLLNNMFTTGLGGAPKGMAFGPDGNLYVADQIGAVVAQIDASTGAILDASFVDLEGGRARFLLWHETGSSEPLVGDYNGNQIVDAADYVVWRDTYGQAGAGLAADGDNDGMIDDDDYDVWSSHFGESAGAGSALGSGSTSLAVPEPAALLLLLFGGIPWAAVQIRKRL